MLTLGELFARPWVPLHGVHVRVERFLLISAAAEERALARLASALGLIEQYDPHRHRLLRELLPRITIGHLFGTASSFNRSKQVLVVDGAHAAANRTTPALLAGSLVWQLTLARARRAARASRRINRERVLRWCLDSQKDFGSRLPAGAPVLSRHDDLVSRPPESWNTEATGQRALDDFTRQVAGTGAPAWLQRLANRWAKRVVR